MSPGHRHRRSVTGKHPRPGTVDSCVSSNPAPTLPLAEQSADLAARGAVVGRGRHRLRIRHRRHRLSTRWPPALSASTAVSMPVRSVSPSDAWSRLTVRNRALFTAAVQPPLVAVGVVILRVIGVKVKGLVTSANVPELNSLLIKQVFRSPTTSPSSCSPSSRHSPSCWSGGGATTRPVVRSHPRRRQLWKGRRRERPRPEADLSSARPHRSPSPQRHGPVGPPLPLNRIRPRTNLHRGGDTPTRRVRPTGEPGFRAAPAVIPAVARAMRLSRGLPARRRGPPGEPAVRPNADRMTAGAMARGVRLDNEDVRRGRPAHAPAVRPAQQARPPAPTAPPAQGRRRAAPPPSTTTVSDRRARTATSPTTTTVAAVVNVGNRSRCRGSTSV